MGVIQAQRPWVPTGCGWRGLVSQEGCLRQCEEWTDLREEASAAPWDREEEGRLSQTVLVVGEATCRYRHLGVVGNLGEGSLGV